MLPEICLLLSLGLGFFCVALFSSVLSVQPLLPEEKKIFFLVVLNYALMMTLKASTICSSLSEPIHGQQDRELDWPGRSYMSTLGLKGGWIQLQL
jgi:hypothetical protein